MTTSTDGAVQPGAGCPLGQLIDPCHDAATSALTTTDWAEDEITAAAGRTPSMSDVLHHAFALLTPLKLGQGFATEFLFRSHAREMLQRVVDQADTRPATAAEVCVALIYVSAKKPLHGILAGLFGRMWGAVSVGVVEVPELMSRWKSHERLYGPQIDDLEQQLRHTLADNSRVMGTVTCTGLHHLKPVSCRFVRRTA